MIEAEDYKHDDWINEVRKRNRSLRRQFLKYKDAEIVYSLTIESYLKWLTRLEQSTESTELC